MNKLLNECYAVKEALSFCNCWAETYKNNGCCRGKSCLSNAAVSGLLFRPLLRSAISSLAFPSCKRFHHSVTSV